MKASQTLEMSTGFTIGLRKGNKTKHIFFIFLIASLFYLKFKKNSNQ